MHEILVRLRITSDGGSGDVYDAVNHVLDSGILQDAINDHDHEVYVESAVVEWPERGVCLCGNTMPDRYQLCADCAKNQDAPHQPVASKEG